MEFLGRLFDTSDFVPRWRCGAWSEPLGWLTIASDVAIWAAYMAIPLVLGFFILRRRDVPFPRVFWLFVAFILACGAVHLVEAVIFWQPVYRLSAALKLLTALVSWCTVIALLRVIPGALALPGLARLNQELSSSIAAAEAANEAKSEFLANVSHEIRTPMTAIMGLSELLVEGLADEEARAHARIIRRSGTHLMQIVDDLLDVSKIEAGQLTIFRERISPGALIEEVRALMSARAGEKGLWLTARSDGPLPATIDSDPTRLRQILMNLVSNAIKFTDAGEVTIVARCVTTGGRPQLEIEVSDSGVGMTAEELERLFEPYFQAATSARRRQGGTGLGLAISRRLARLLGGDLVVRSRAGEGSTFTLRIDAGPLQGVPMLAPEASLSSDPSDARPARRRRISGRILLAEGSEKLRKLLGFFVEQAGGVVTTVNDGEQAIDAVRTAAAEGDPFDVVLMDLQMPKLDGLEATMRLRAAGFRLPIIALTASAMQRDREECLAAGCDDFATKPIDAGQLVDLIARHLPESNH